MCFDRHGMKLEMNNKKTLGKFVNLWKANSIFPNNKQFKKKNHKTH